MQAIKRGAVVEFKSLGGEFIPYRLVCRTRDGYLAFQCGLTGTLGRLGPLAYIRASELGDRLLAGVDARFPSRRQTTVVRPFGRRTAR